jgi:two-component system phosphate regulon response regulator OmpR
MNSILRRVPKPADPAPEVRLGAWLFVPDRDELRNGDEIVRLTSTEAGLLRILSAQPGTILSREELAERVGVAGNALTVDVQVSRLRSKIEPDPKLPRYLHTVRGEGYVLRPDI